MKILLFTFTIFIYFSSPIQALTYEFLKNEQDRKDVKKELQSLKNTVHLIVFTTKAQDCRYCELTQQIIKEISSLSDKIKPQYYDIDKDKNITKNYAIDKTPAIIISDGKNNNIRFYGVPGGYEFSALIETMKIVSSGHSSLSQKNIDKLKKIKNKITIQVFVTPTCPYCPLATVTAHKMAMANKKIFSEMIEAQEFMDLSMQNNVSTVPKVVIVNDKGKRDEFTGAYPEDQFVEKVLSVK